jgi:rubrerythrin
MDALLDDIRLLKLAEMHERAYESFILEMADRYVRDEAARGEIRKLVGSTDDHGARIAKLLAELSAKVPSEKQPLVERAALLDIIDVEHLAREFYLPRIDQAHDKRVIELFRELARQEALHVRIAQDALRASDEHHGLATQADMEKALRMLGDEGTPLWEGSGEPKLPSRETKERKGRS